MDHPISVLFLDDEENILNALRRVFAKEDFGIVTCTSAPEALEIVEKQDIAVIVSDFRMPGMTGAEFLHLAKQIRPASVRIMLTGFSEIDTAISAINEGEVYRYLTKPWDEESLKNTIRHAIDRYRAVRLTEELLEKKKELEALNLQKNQLIGMIAHDLRNPLTAIMGIAELLGLQLMGSLDADQLKCLAHLRASSLYMVGLINNMLDIRVVESGAVNLDLRQTDIALLVRESIDLNSILSKSKNISIHLAQDSPLPPLFIDRIKIAQALHNLLSNAVKYSNPGSTIWVQMSQKNASVIISVKDEGPGLLPEEIGRVFEPYMKGSAKPTAGEKSTGLGLAIARKVVEGHRGEITVESQIGIGTTFSIILPAITPG